MALKCVCVWGGVGTVRIPQIPTPASDTNAPRHPRSPYSHKKPQRAAPNTERQQGSWHRIQTKSQRYPDICEWRVCVCVWNMSLNVPLAREKGPRGQSREPREAAPQPEADLWTDKGQQTPDPDRAKATPMESGPSLTPAGRVLPIKHQPPIAQDNQHVGRVAGRQGQSLLQRDGR